MERKGILGEPLQKRIRSTEYLIQLSSSSTIKTSNTFVLRTAPWPEQCRDKPEIMENTEGLPSHYHFFASLIDSLSGRAPPRQAGASNDDAVYREQGDAAREHNRRKLLLTLHVLFPSLLLPALDLLDRDLVTKICLGPEDSDISQDGPAGTMPLYVVRSVASTVSGKRHRSRMGADSAVAHSYEVRLASWNCTCASFTFEAFPPVPSARMDTLAATPAVRDYETSDVWWSGDLSVDGMTEDAPCCKHLLACLLVERRITSQEDFLRTRHVTKDELAGLIAGI